jgi:hypothetical protein
VVLVYGKYVSVTIIHTVFRKKRRKAGFFAESAAEVVFRFEGFLIPFVNVVRIPRLILLVCGRHVCVYECGVAIGKKIDRLPRSKIIENAEKATAADLPPVSQSRPSALSHAITCGD